MNDSVKKCAFCQVYEAAEGGELCPKCESITRGGLPIAHFLVLTARIKELEERNNALEDVILEVLAYARTSLIPDTFEPYVADHSTRLLHWNEHMRMQIAKLIDAAIK